jgi:hypothetical protein
VVEVAIRTLISLAAYLLNFLRQVHGEDLRAERELERYRYHVDRASWVIETALEAQLRDGEQEPVEIPPDWVQGVTRSLFQRREIRDPESNALAAVGSLFNFAAEAEVGPGGTRLKFKRPGGCRNSVDSSPLAHERTGLSPKTASEWSVPRRRPTRSLGQMRCSCPQTRFSSTSTPCLR